VSGRAPAEPIQATIPHASSTATGSGPCWIWPQSCRSPRQRFVQRIAVESPITNCLAAARAAAPPSTPGSLEPADRSNTPLPASSVREGHRILFAALCESLRFTENGKCSSAAWPSPICRRAHARSNCPCADNVGQTQRYSLANLDQTLDGNCHGFLPEFIALICE